MFDFNDDGEFGLDDLIEADIQYGLFEEDEKAYIRKLKKAEKRKKQNQKNFWSWFKF